MTIQLPGLERVSSLERQNRILKGCIGVLFMMALPFAVTAAQQSNRDSDIVRASQFEVVSDGKTMARLSSVAGSGGRQLMIFNRTGQNVGVWVANDLGSVFAAP